MWERSALAGAGQSPAIARATIIPLMDNKAIAGILYETADLLEIDAQDSFRIRSYRNAAEAIEAMSAAGLQPDR